MCAVSVCCFHESVVRAPQRRVDEILHVPQTEVAMISIGVHYALVEHAKEKKLLAFAQCLLVLLATKCARMSTAF